MNIKKTAAAIVFSLLPILLSGQAQAREYILANFDNVPGTPFSYKDEKGTEFRVTQETADLEKGKSLVLTYDITREGWGGWGLALNGMNCSEYAFLTFNIKGEAGGEIFDIALKDTVGVEKKLPLIRFSDVSKTWRQVRIPLKEFEGLNLSSIDNLNIVFVSSARRSKVFIDDIALESPLESETKDEASTTFVGKVTIDSFERANPTDLYLVYEGDESSLKLSASRVSKDGDYAMELEYLLSTSRPWGSWVAAQWNAKEVVLDWRGAQEIKLWVKGDGSGNIFRFFIKDSDGERYYYEDREVLKSTRWVQVAMPVARFIMEKESDSRNRILDLDQIRGYAFMVLGSGGSSTSSGVKNTAGKITVDQLYIVGQKMSAAWAVPPKVVDTEKIRLLRIGNIDFNGQILTEFLNAPEQKSTVFSSGKLITNGKIGNYSAKLELASESQEFGESARYSLDESTRAGVTTVNRFPAAQTVNIQAIANNVSPYLTQLTVGSQFIDYTPFTFAPEFGYKGLSLEGDVDFVNYHAFILKHRYDSYTVGSRVKGLWQGIRATAVTVYYRETAKIANSATQSGTSLTTNSNLELQDVQNDWTYTVDSERLFLEDRVLLGGTFGYNKYTQRASADRSDPFNPVFGSALEPALIVDGRMARGRFGLQDLSVPGLKLNYEYRSVDTEFKPRYRQLPINFDDLESDQRGHNFRVTEKIRGFQSSFEFDTMERNSNKDYYRHKFAWAVGYYGFHNLDVAFNQEFRREEYQFVSNRTAVSYNANQKIAVSEIYMRAQLSPQLTLFFRPKREDIVHPATGLTFSNESLYGKVEYYPITNIKVLGEFRTSHYGVKTQEPQGQPYDDNFVRLKLEFNF